MCGARAERLVVSLLMVWVFDSLEIDDLLAFKELLKTTSVEASTSDHKAGDTCGIDGFLALLLELECHFVLVDLLDRFGGHGSALLLNRCQIDGCGITEESNDEVASNEADSFTRVLEFFSELRQVGDVERGAVLLTLAEELVRLAIAQDSLDLKLKNLLLLFLIVGLQALRVVEEAHGSVRDLLLVHTPGLT